jgi:spermidine synthase
MNHWHVNESRYGGRHVHERPDAAGIEVRAREVPKLTSLPSPWPCEPGVVRFCEPAEGVGPALLQLLRDDRLGRPYVVENGSRRHLFFTLESVQSSMDLDRPDELVSAYTRKMMAFLLLNPNPRHIVMIGLGGGSLAKFCHRHLRNTRIDVVERDADVLALRDLFCIPGDDDRFRVIHGDGVDYVRGVPEQVDVILVDAFDAQGISHSLAHSDFFENVGRRLRDDGVFVMNFSGVRSRYVPNLNAIRAVFGHQVLLVPVQVDGNLLVFATKSDIVDRLNIRGDATAESLQRCVGLEFPSFLTRMRRAHAFSGPSLDVET